MGGQFNLFDKAKNISVSKSLKKDLNEYKAGLESQKKYMQDYAANYEAVTKAVSEANPDVSGSFMAELADGSAESAQILANLANAAPGEVESIVKAYADAETARQKYAADLAESQTKFSETMDGLQAELEATVQAMDFSSEASANAKTALDAFVDAADAYIGPARAAYKRVADAAAEGLKFNPTFLSFLFPGGYASGTDDAEPGLKLVGEEGPELVMFKGGEKVLDAQETEDVLRNAEPEDALPLTRGMSEGGGNVNKTYNVNVTIPAINANGADAEKLLEAITDNLKDQIISTLEEYEEDNERRNLT